MKRKLSIILAVCLIITAIPVAVFAADNESNQEGKIFSLASNTDLNVQMFNRNRSGIESISSPRDRINISPSDILMTFVAKDSDKVTPVFPKAVSFVNNEVTPSDAVALTLKDKITFNNVEYLPIELVASKFGRGNIEVTFDDDSSKLIPISISLPTIGFFKSESFSEEDYISNNNVFELNSDNLKTYLVAGPDYVITSVSAINCNYASLNLSNDGKKVEITFDKDNFNFRNATMSLLVDATNVNGSNHYTGRNYDLKLTNGFSGNSGNNNSGGQNDKPLGIEALSNDGFVGIVLPQVLTEREFEYSIVLGTTSAIEGTNASKKEYVISTTFSKGDINHWIETYYANDMLLRHFAKAPAGTAYSIFLSGNVSDLENTFNNMISNVKTLSGTSLTNYTKVMNGSQFVVANEGREKIVLSPGVRNGHKSYVAWFNDAKELIGTYIIYLNENIGENYSTEFKYEGANYPASDRLTINFGDSIGYEYSSVSGDLTLHPIDGKKPECKSSQITVKAPAGYQSEDGKSEYSFGLVPSGTMLRDIQSVSKKLIWYNNATNERFIETIYFEIEGVVPGFAEYWKPVSSRTITQPDDPNMLVTYNATTGEYRISFSGDDFPKIESLFNQKIAFRVPAAAKYYRAIPFGTNQRPTSTSFAERERGIIDNASYIDVMDEPLVFQSIALRRIELDGISIFVNDRANMYDGFVIEWYNENKEKLAEGVYAYGSSEDLVKEVITESVDKVDNPVTNPVIEFRDNNGEHCHLVTKHLPQLAEGNYKKYFQLEPVGMENGTEKVAVYLPYSFIGIESYEEAIEKGLANPVIHHYDEKHESYEVIECEYTVNGIRFETASFSPFTIQVPEPEAPDVKIQYIDFSILDNDIIYSTVSPLVGNLVNEAGLRLVSFVDGKDNKSIKPESIEFIPNEGTEEDSIAFTNYDEEIEINGNKYNLYQIDFHSLGTGKVVFTFSNGSTCELDAAILLPPVSYSSTTNHNDHDYITSFTVTNDLKTFYLTVDEDWVLDSAEPASPEFMAAVISENKKYATVTVDAKKIGDTSYTSLFVTAHDTVNGSLLENAPFGIGLDIDIQNPDNDDYGDYDDTPSAPSSPSVPTIPTEPVVEQTSIKTDEVVAVDGTAEVEVKAEDINKSVEAALKADETVEAIKIETAVKGDAEIISVALPTEALKNVADNTNASIDIETPNGTVSITNEALQFIVSQAGDSNSIEITIVESAVDSVKSIIEAQADDVLADADKAFDVKNLEGAVAVDFNIVVGNEKIHSFGGEKLEVVLPLAAKTHSHGKYYRTFVVSADGTVDVTVAKVNNGKAHVVAPHFSTFVVTTEECTPFLDVELGQWFTDSVIFAYENKIMIGNENGLFDKNATMTRSMLVTMLYNLVGAPDVSSNANPFVDVASGAWYESAVKWAYANKIVGGVDATHYAPDKAITREELVTMLYNYAKSINKVSSKTVDFTKFIDADAISAWALDAVKWANAEKVVEGSGNRIMPGATATRVEGAALFTKFMQNVK